MKKIWWASLFILLVLNCVLLVNIWRFVPMPADVELQQTPRMERALTVQLPLRSLPADIGAMVNTCIFDQERGQRKEVAAETPPAERPDFELIGITRLGEESGAIIENKSQSDVEPKKIRRYYVLGDDVGNGFKLNSVLDGQVILKREGEVLELKIGRTRFGEQAQGQASLQKIAAEVPLDVPKEETPVVFMEQSGKLLPPGAAAPKDVQ